MHSFIVLQNHYVMFPALFFDLWIFVFFYFCAELVFRKCIGKKEMLTKISKCLCWNLFIGAAVLIRAVYKDNKILVSLKRCITFSLSFLICSTKFQLFYDCRTYENIFCPFDNSTNNNTKTFNLKVNCKKLWLVFIHHVNTEYT